MSVQITNPTFGKILTGTVNVTATTDVKRFVQATLFVDGKQWGGADQSLPIQFPLDTTKLTDGNHMLQVNVQYRALYGAKGWQHSSVVVAVKNATEPPPPPPPPSGADFVADPNLTGTLAPWDKFDPGNAASTDGIWVSAQPAGATSPGFVGVVTDPLGQQGKVYKETVTPTAQASTASGSDATYLFNYAKPYLGLNGQENWVHFRMMLPSGYQPTPGEWNIFNEFHNNSDFMPFYDKGQIGWEYPEVALYVANYTGDQPRLLYRVRGGISGANNFDGTDVLADPLKLDHWYDILLHIVWSPTRGLFEWWLDGITLCSLARPTLWQRPDGSTDHVELELNNYRQHSTYNSTVYYSKLKVGQSQAAVAF